MANLRANNLSGEQGQNAYRGSVFFDGEEGTFLSLASGAIISGTGFGTNDFTVEFWINQGVNASNYTNIFSLYASTNVKRFQIAFNSSTIQVYTNTGSWADTGYAPVSGVYEHIAFVRNYSGNTLKMYANGEEKWSVSNNRDYDEVFETFIGDGPTDAYSAFQGYLSNLRVLNGTALYTTNYFTPPTSELKAIPNTILLCCQDSDDPTKEETGKTITAAGGRFQTGNNNILKNGDFSQGTDGFIGDSGASISASGGVMTVTNGGGDNLYALAQQSCLRIGRKYRCTATITPTFASGNPVFRVRFGGDAVSFTQQESTMSTGVAFRLDTGEKVADGTTFEIGSGSSSGITQFTVTDLVVTAIDPPIPIKNIPPYGVDAGNTFGGPIQQSSQGYMCFPTGRTEERGGTRACWFRGYVQAGSNDNTIDFSEMSSRGNAVHFGDALSSNRQAGALGSSTRGVFGGRDGSSNVIEFITFSTQSNSSDFGDFTVGRSGSPGTASDGTRGLFFGGYAPNIASANAIEFITIASLGNGTDFGDLTNAGSEAAGCASPTRAIRMGGRLTGNNPTDVIDFFTIQTVGNAQDFGDLTVGRSEAGGASSNTRGVCIAGYNYPGGGQNVIDFVTIASSGNATDFGDLAAYTDSWQGGSGSNNVIIAHGIGYNDSARDNRIDFITIATTGNSVDYGDLTNQRSQIPCATNGHGGLS